MAVGEDAVAPNAADDAAAVSKPEEVEAAEQVAKEEAANDAEVAASAEAAKEQPIEEGAAREETSTAAQAEAEAEAAASAEAAKEEAKVEAAPEPKKRGRKRKADADAAASPAKPPARRGRPPKAKPVVAMATENGNAEAAADGEETDSDGAQETKAKRPKKAAAGKKAGAPRKKAAKLAVEGKEEEDDQLDQRVEALPEEVRAKFGQIVWVKMSRFPFWPALVMDPRRLQGPLRATAAKDLETRYVVRFYESNNFTAALFKTIEPWTDTKADYRQGYPLKDAKAPKRREQLIKAIEQAEADVALPIEERMGGILKQEEPSENDEETSDEELPKTEAPVVEKRKRGRPLGSKNKPKVANGEPKEKAKRGRKKKSEAETAPAESEEPEVEEAEATPDEDVAATPSLSKEEIKAKVASRKAPSRKKPKADANAAGTSRKSSKASSVSRTEGKTSADIDMKRKKEIELVVPRKTVKSADIREATEEAARKKLDRKNVIRDKIQYKVGDLARFASKMTKLFANESSKNNDELIQMLARLLEEDTVYRSDAERSGLAPIIAAVRKSSNPTVAQTASGVRRHLMKVLNDDVASGSSHASTKHKSDTSSDARQKKKRKTDDQEDKQKKPVDSDSAPPLPKEVKPNIEKKQPKSETDQSDEGHSSVENASVESTPKHESDKPSISSSSAEATPEVSSVEATPDQSPAQVTPEPTDELKAEKAPVESKTEASESVVPTEKSKPTSPPKPLDANAIKNRKICVDMLSKMLESDGADNSTAAQEIEKSLFDRYSECNDEYRAHARKIMFGLRDQPAVRDRLISGSLHALELVYNDEFFDLA